MQRLRTIWILLAVALVAAACADTPQAPGDPGAAPGEEPADGEQDEAGVESADDPADEPADATQIRLGLPTGVTSFANSDAPVAAEQGFFAEEGLDVEWQNFRSGLPVVQAVVAGELDIGAASIEPVINAIVGGGDLVIIGGYADRLTVSMVTPETITSPADLAGEDLGVQDVGAFREVMTRMVLEDAGLTPDDVNYLPVDAQAYISALLQDQIASAILQREQAVDAVARDGRFQELVDLYEIEPDYYYGTYFVSRDWLEENRDVAVGFLRAITQAHRFMYEDPEATIPIVAEATEFSEEVVAEAYEGLMDGNGVFPVNEGLEQDRIEYTIERMESLGILEGDPPADDELVDRDPISEVIEELGAWEDDERWH